MNCGDATFLDESGRWFVPLLEGRSVGAYDCFQKTWVSGSGRTAVWKENADQPLSQCSPQYVIAPIDGLPPRVALCDVTASTNTRTVIAAKVPSTWRCGNTAPVLEFDGDLLAFAGLGIMNTMVFDWIARRLASGLHLNKFILEGFVWPQLDEVGLSAAANAAWSICVGKPRAGLMPDEMATTPWVVNERSRRSPRMSEIEAAAQLEILTARGLGLTRQDLEAIYQYDRGDRRGFWRYFDAEPRALLLVKRVLSLV